MKKALFFILMAVALMVFKANAQVTILSEGFEAGTIPADWTVIDADGDGSAWEVFPQGHLNNYDGSSVFSSSQGKTPDDWLVTPAITLGNTSSLSLWRMTGFMSPADHYGVYVSTTSATDTSSFTLLYEETSTAGSTWVERTVNLSAYDNSTIYIAIRHFNCSNQYGLIVDDILVTSQTSTPIITVSPTSLQFFDVPIGTSSAGQHLTVNSFNVTGMITAVVLPPFEISTDDTNYALGLSLNETNHDLYVRYTPNVVGTDSAVLNLTSGTASANVHLYGNSITCAAPSGLTVSTVTSTSAVVNWTGSASNYNIYYKTTTDVNWTVITNVPANSAGYTILNLSPSTTYAWTMASVCDDGTLINSTETGMFTTGCAAVSAPFVQNFDASTSLPQCWSRYTGWVSDVLAGGALNSTTGGWGFNNSYVFGANHARVNVFGTNCNRWLVTPAIDLSGLTNPALTFDMALTAWNCADPIESPNGQPDDKFMVIISTDDGATWDVANATVWSNDTLGDYVYNQIPTAGQEFAVSLADYAGQTVKIAFYAESTVENGDNDLHIDNVMVDEATSCKKPTNLSVVNVTGNSVTLSWTENGTATAWNIEYGPTGYQQGSTVATMVQADSNIFTLTNLGVAVYDFYVQSNCGDEQSLWIGPITAAPGSFNMSIIGTDTLTTCALIVYDNGGAMGNYAPSCDYTLVLQPEISGNAIAISGTYHTETCCDYLRIFDGVGNDATLLGEYKGNGTIPTLVASSGPMTLSFHSDGGLQYSGLELYVTCVTCVPPADLTVSNIGPDSADLSWADMSNTYTVEYRAADDTAWTTVTTNDTTFALTGLTPSTDYTVNVFSNCDGESSPAVTVTFTTTMVPSSIPFSTDFNSTAGWILNNGSCNSYWTIGSISDTTNALFVTSNGTTPGYNKNSFSAVTAEKLFTVGDAAEFEISFDVQIGGETEFDYLKVFFAPADEEYPASNANNTYTPAAYSVHAVNFSDYLQYSTFPSLPFKYNLTDGNTISVNVVMPNPNNNPDATSTAKLVFLWKNDNNGGTQPGAIVKHVSISTLACPAPINLAVSNVTTTSANVAWESAGDENEWVLEYRENNAAAWTSVPVVATPAYVLNNLNPGTTYQVRVQSVCSADDQSMWTSTMFTTFCDAITTFPFIENFENDGQMPDCWMQEHINGNLNWVFKAGGDNSGGIHSAHGGNYNAHLSVASQEASITSLVSPILDLSGMDDAYITFWYAQEPWGQTLDFLTVLYRTSPSSPWQLLVQYSNPVSTWTKDSLALPNLSATYQLAFEGLAHHGHGIELDDITVDGTIDTTVVPEPCEAPTDLHQVVVPVDKDPGFILVEWTDNAGASKWNLQYRHEGTEQWNTVVTTGTGYWIDSNVEAWGHYEIRVQAICDDDLLSDWSDTIMATAQGLGGIDDYLLSSINLYPNPANDVVNVECRMQNAEYEVEAVEVYDVYGKLVNTVVVNENPIRINISNLADGMYFVRVTTDAGAVTKRFMKK